MTTYEVTAYRPTGAILRYAICYIIADIGPTIGRLRRETRDTLGWTPAIRVWQHKSGSRRDVTAWYPDA